MYDNEAFDLVLTGIDLDMIKAIKFTTVTTVISTNTLSDNCRNHVPPHPRHILFDLSWRKVVSMHKLPSRFRQKYNTIPYRGCARSDAW